jgi:hypothetical protein
VPASVAGPRHASTFASHARTHCINSALLADALHVFKHCAPSCWHVADAGCGCRGAWAIVIVAPSTATASSRRSMSPPTTRPASYSPPTQRAARTYTVPSC